MAGMNNPAATTPQSSSKFRDGLLGIILLLIGLVAVLYSLMFWSNLTPWGRRRIIARRRLVGGTRTEKVIEERPLDDGLP
jgi:hypothetical protein